MNISALSRKDAKYFLILLIASVKQVKWETVIETK